MDHAYNAGTSLKLGMFIYLLLGIKIQSERISLRFFVQQMHNGYRIVFTGMCSLTKLSFFPLSFYSHNYTSSQLMLLYIPIFSTIQ